MVLMTNWAIPPAPTARIGAETSLRVQGVKIGARWELKEASEILPSKAVAENQFRDRTRVASQIQISHIAAAPAFDLLADSPLMDFGAPTLAEDGVTIIGGNGRAAGIVQAYRMGTADEYRRELIESAPRYGLSTAGMREPVLVRRFTQPVDIRMAALASNEGGGLRLSMLEQARIDAERIGSLSDFHSEENGLPNLKASHACLQRFLSSMPDIEQAGLVDAAGRLSQEGLVRVRNAVLCRAYGDSPTLGRLVESVDPGLRNLAAALVRVAPKIADARERMSGGDLYPLDIVDQLLEAVEQINLLRSQGISIDAFLEQLGLFGDTVSTEIASILRHLDASTRSAKGVADFLSAYYDQVIALGSPKQEGIFGATEVPTKEEILKVSATSSSRPLAPKKTRYPASKLQTSINPTLASQVGGGRSRTADLDQVRDQSTKLSPLLGGDSVVPSIGVAEDGVSSAAVMFTHSCVNAYRDQTTNLLQAWCGSTLVGQLNYCVFRGAPSIDMIEVPVFKRRGFGAALVRELQRSFPGVEIDWGFRTTDGQALYDALPKQVVETESKVKFDELAAIRSELSALERHAEDFWALTSPSVDQRREFNLRWEGWRDLETKKYALEAELQFAQPMKTIILEQEPPRLDAAAVDRLEELRRVVRASAVVAGRGVGQAFWANAEERFGPAGAQALAEMMELLGVDKIHTGTAKPSQR